MLDVLVPPRYPREFCPRIPLGESYIFWGTKMPKKSQQKLTKRVLDGLIPIPGKDYSIWDSEVSGFGVRVKPSGKRSFHIKYRTENGRQRKTTLGSYGQLTVEQARKLARKELGQVAAGDDPADIRLQKKQAKTVTELCDQYLADAISGKIIC